MSKTIIVIIILSIIVLGAGWYNRSNQPDTQTIYIGPTTVECVGVAPQRCLQIKYHPDENYSMYYDSIEGFTHTPGYQYTLEVAQEIIPNPPADSSSQKLVLVKEVSQEPVPYIIINTPKDRDQLEASQPITVTGQGRGLFEGNVVLQVEDRQSRELITEEITTMNTNEVGGEGTWSITFDLPIDQDIRGGLRAFSPSPKDGSADINYSLPVTFSILAGQNLSLENTNWQVTSYRDDTNSDYFSQPIEGTALTTIFDGVQVTGSSGCNSYFGPYTTKADQVDIGPLGSTLKACPDPIMNQEQKFLKSLQNSKTYYIDGVVLTMLNQSGETTLIYEAQKPMALENTPWQAQGINNGKGGVVSTATTSQSTALFQDGFVSGNSGCNTYQGSYQTNSTNTIQIGPLAATKKACPEELMEQEQQFLSALERSNTYTIENDRLNLRENNSTMVNFAISNTQ